MSSVRLAPVPSTDQFRPTPDASSETAHPSPADATDRVRPIGSLSFKALRAIVGGLTRVERPLPPDIAAPGPRSCRLIATAFYDAWLITWPDGSGLESHDHGDVRSAFEVIDGQLTEVHADRRAATEAAVRTLGRGTVTFAEPTIVHSLTNRSGADATSIHAYSPPLADVTFTDQPTTGRTVPLRSTRLADRPATATSPGAVAPGTASLTLIEP